MTRAANIIPFKYDGDAVSFNAEGWINATQAAARFGKQPAQWLRLPDAKRYLEGLKRTYGKITYVKTSRAREDRGGGTWLHPKLAVKFARWLSVDFEIWCDEHIDSLIRGDAAKDWLAAREQVSTLHSSLCDVLHLTRQANGKATQPHHYMNEAKLINGVLFGAFEGRSRSALTKRELTLVRKVETRNITMLATGHDYQQRKVALVDYAGELMRKGLGKDRT